MMTGEEIERLEELEQMAENGDIEKGDESDEWEELAYLRAKERDEKRAAKATAKAQSKWSKAKTVLHVYVDDPRPSEVISFYVTDRSELKAVIEEESWPDELVALATVTEVDKSSVPPVEWQELYFETLERIEERQRREDEYTWEWPSAPAALPEAAIVPVHQVTALQAAGQVANVYAAANAFADYTARKAENTLGAHRADLATFAEYLCAVTAGADCPDVDQLQHEPAAWHGVTHGLVTGFVRWLLGNGYAIGSVNRKLSTVRVYAKLAAQAKVIDATEATLIRGVTGYGGTEGKRQDEKRTAAEQATRTGRKKSQHVPLTLEQARALKTQPDTPQGRRDAVIMCLLLDHGLRVGELAILPVTAFDLKAGTFAFYRPKVDKVQTHRMTHDTVRAVAAWLHTDAPAMGPLLRGSRKAGKQKDGPKGAKVHGNGKLTDAGMSERAITERVRELGASIGVAGLSAHDCRHYWATRAATMGTDSFALRDAGGWNSLAMPSRYVEAATVANERVKL